MKNFSKKTRKWALPVLLIYSMVLMQCKKPNTDPVPNQNTTNSVSSNFSGMIAIGTTTSVRSNEGPRPYTATWTSCGAYFIGSSVYIFKDSRNLFYVGTSFSTFGEFQLSSLNGTGSGKLIIAEKNDQSRTINATMTTSGSDDFYRYQDISQCYNIPFRVFPDFLFYGGQVFPVGKIDFDSFISSDLRYNYNVNYWTNTVLGFVSIDSSKVNLETYPTNSNWIRLKLEVPVSVPIGKYSLDTLAFKTSLYQESGTRYPGYTGTLNKGEINILVNDKINKTISGYFNATYKTSDPFLNFTISGGKFEIKY